ncbi:sodium:solute symporter family protein [Opitutales bacterium]|nr:sodium:solute symporter family protein [Opitutales bacterium]MDC3282584.1 sodium:solute symporter family protein [Opitutales bacterium]
MNVLLIISGYLSLLLLLGWGSGRMFRGTSRDFFVASHSIGPFLLLMSVFGTTMTAFALVGSTGKSFERGIGTYGLMASISGLIHMAIFFLIGIRLWALGKRHGYLTQIQFFRARFESDGLGYILFPILVLLVVPYLLIGIIGAGKVIEPVTAGAFPDLFTNPTIPAWVGGIPPWLTGLVICIVVLTYVFLGGSRGTALANAFQTVVFMAMGIVAFYFVVQSLGGLEQAGKVPMRITEDGSLVQDYRFDQKAGILLEQDPPKKIGQVLNFTNSNLTDRHPHLGRDPIVVEFKKKNPKTGELVPFERELGIPFITFVTYLFIPLSVGMFPHLFQHWLTARNARAFKLTVIAHPLCILIVWVPCVLIGSWATGLLPPGIPPPAVLSATLNMLVGDPWLTGLLTAGVLAAIMSSMDSQFLCLGTVFTNDIVVHRAGSKVYSDSQKLKIARSFIVIIVAVTYLLAMAVKNANVFDLAIWCFSGFAALFPLVFSALYWKRATKAGAIASVLTALISWAWFFHQSGYGGEYFVGPGIVPAAICFLVSAGALVVVSLLTSPPAQSTIDQFFPSRS